jgi:hypothetical protein
MLLLNLSLLITVTFSTPTGVIAQNPVVSEIAISRQLSDDEAGTIAGIPLMSLQGLGDDLVSPQQFGWHHPLSVSGDLRVYSPMLSSYEKSFGNLKVFLSDSTPSAETSLTSTAVGRLLH